MSKTKTETKKPIITKSKPQKSSVKTKLKKISDPSQAFWVNNGPICHNINELKKALETMSDEQYTYHTKRDGNDFSNWLSTVMGHTVCADKVRRARTRAGAFKALSACSD